MDTVTADLQIPHLWTLLYANNVTLACKTQDGIELLVNQWKTWLDIFGVRLNLVKIKYLECGVQTDGTIIVDGTPLVKASYFCYLGSV